MANVSSLLQRAQAAHVDGGLTEALELSREALSLDEKSVHANLLAGISASNLGLVDPAEQYLLRCLELDATCFPAHVWLAILFSRAGNPQALVHARQAVRIQPTHPETQNALGLALLSNGDFLGAKNAFEKALDANRLGGAYHFGLSMAQEGLGLIQDSLKSLRRAVKYAPNPMWAWKLGMAELASGNISKAREIATRMVDSDTSSSQAHFLMAKVLQRENKIDESDEQLKKALALDADNEIVLQELGIRSQSLGQFSDAIGVFQRLIELNPTQGSAYYGVVSSKKITAEDMPLVTAMESVANQDRIDQNERTMLEFALGKAYQDLKEPEKAMRHFDLANKLSALLNFRGREFDRAGFKEGVDKSIDLFTPEFLAKQPRGSSSDSPIFIVGMIRSGTTLMEHILSCHSQIGAAGEQEFWAGREDDLIDFRKRSIDKWTLESSSQAYLHLLQELAPGKVRVTDKNPANVLSLGLIHLAFPNARIIHMRRNPVDTMLSIYTTAIRNPPPFACDRDNIVFAYRQYQRVIDHWRTLLPSDRFIDVDYETLVGDQQAETRNILEFLGLQWEETCALPEKNPRAVNTPSLWQVRQKIHQSSVNKWKEYEPWLGPFADFIPQT